jgi:hypothetical protein
MAIPLRSLPSEIFRELKTRKGLTFIIFAVVSFSLLVVARQQQPWYTSNAVIVLEHAMTNTSGGLVPDQTVAAAPAPDKVALVLGEINRLDLVQKAAKIDFTGVAATAEDIELGAETIRQHLTVQPFGGNRLILSYRDRQPQKAFNVLQTLVEGLTRPVPVVKENVPELSADDRTSLQMLDEQIAAYRERVKKAEIRLEKFLEFSPSEDIVATQARVTELEGTIEMLDRERDVALKRKRLLGLQDEASPELRTLSAQIDAMSENKRVTAVALANARAYQEKLLLSGAEADALKKSLESETQALANLVGRRGSLLSNPGSTDPSPSLAGTTASYHVFEAASFPLSPEGIPSVYLTYSGLLAGFLAPVVLFGLFCFVDPRVRSAERLESRTGIPVLMSIPSLTSPLEKRLERNRLFWLVLMAVFLVLTYCYLAWFRLNGGST